VFHKQTLHALISEQFTTLAIFFKVKAGSHVRFEYLGRLQEYPVMRLQLYLVALDS
jgi:hypothetical protein